MPYLLLMRHGQSTYNLENRFTGELDVPLSPLGIEEAAKAAIKLKDYPVDVAYTSKLQRAIDTLQIILKSRNQNRIEVIETEALNERNYGVLQGLNKSDIIKQYGEARVLEWRRSFYVAPPGGESLKDTSDRVMPFFNSVVRETLKKNKHVLIVAHGNSLRAILKELDALDDKAIADVEIRTGEIYAYGFEPRSGVFSKIAF